MKDSYNSANIHYRNGDKLMHLIQIGGKMFAAICLDDSDKPYYITLKLEPLEGDFWRKQYEDIIPGYYMNKQHWNSVKADGEVPDDIFKRFA